MRNAFMEMPLWGYRRTVISKWNYKDSEGGLENGRRTTVVGNFSFDQLKRRIGDNNPAKNLLVLEGGFALSDSRRLMHQRTYSTV